MQLPADALSVIRDHYDAGQYCRAASAAAQWGPAGDWDGPDARVLGGRLAGNLGAGRLSDYLHVTAHREYPDHPEARLFFAMRLYQKRGPWATWSWLRDADTSGEGDPEILAQLASLRGRLCGEFRDAQGVGRWLGRARELAPWDPWVRVEESIARAHMDQRAEAEASAREALELRPWYRSAVQQLAELLVARNADQEALDLLSEGSRQTESGALVQQLIVLLSERDEPERIPELCDSAESRMPWIEPEVAEWFAARRAQAYWSLGDRASASDWAARVSGSLHRDFVDQLRAGTGRRIRLSVPFHHQDQATCAPATLASLTAYWGAAADHAQITDAICYNGTLPHAERAWLDSAGWITREFRLTRESAIALLDRGVPFAVATIWARGGHMQAVMGYDTARDSLLIREPGRRHYAEVSIDPFLKYHRAFGPRALLLLPQTESARLAGIELPQATEYDLLHTASVALDRHDRERAGQLIEALERRDPEGSEVLMGRLSLAGYDGNNLERHRCATVLAERFPAHPRPIMLRLAGMRETVRRRERVAFLEEALTGPASDPCFLMELAFELAPDSAESHRVERLLSKYLRCFRGDAAGLWRLGTFRWSRGDREDAVDLLRFAACLEEKEGVFARDWFAAANFLGRSDEAIEMLRARWLSFGRKSGEVAETYFAALAALNRDTEGFEMLSGAIGLRPDDGELLLFCASAWARAGDRESARRLLDSAERRARRAAWLRGAAELASVVGNREEEQSRWHQIAEEQPTAPDAHQALARFAGHVGGPMATMAHWDAVCERFPHSWPFACLRLEAARAEGPAFAEPYARALVALDERSAFARDQLAQVLAGQGRRDEALAEAQSAVQIEPRSAPAWTTLGSLLIDSGERQSAAQALRRAVELDANAVIAARRLVWLEQDAKSRDDALDFIRRQIEAQPGSSEGILLFGELAGLVWGLERGRRALEAMWGGAGGECAIWSALTSLLVRGGAYADAMRVAAQAIGRFPLLPSVWHGAATAHDAAGEVEKAMEFLRRAISLNPHWMQCRLQLARLLRRDGNLKEALVALDEAVRREPLDPHLRMNRASVLWDLGRHDEAFGELHLALGRQPDLLAAWHLLCAWCDDAGRGAHPKQLVRSFLDVRPRDARMWWIMAQRCAVTGDADEAFTALDRALEIDPRFIEASDLKARLLVDEGRWAEARAHCEAPIWAGRPPLELKGRLAWIDAAHGDLKGAVERMRGLLVADPSYQWGWSQLVDWLEKAGDVEGAIDASLKWAAAEPENAWPLSRAAWLEGARDRPGRADDLAGRALDLDPGCDAALRWVLRRLVAQKKAEHAMAQLRRSRPFLDRITALAFEIALDASFDRIPAAVSKFERLCGMPGVNPTALAIAVDGVAAGQATPQFDATLDLCVWRPECRSEPAKFWVGRQMAKGRWDLMDSLVSLPMSNGVRREAISTFLDLVGDRRAGNLVMRDAIAKHRETLRSDTLLWGKSGYALVASGLLRETVEWMDDWRDRPDSQPWMLFNLALAAMATGARDAAIEVSEAALGRASHTRFAALHRIWLALGLVVSGRTEEADTLLRANVGIELDREQELANDAIRALVDSAAWPEEERADRIRDRARELANRCLNLQERPAWLLGTLAEVESRWGVKFPGLLSADTGFRGIRPFSMPPVLAGSGRHWGGGAPTAGRDWAVPSALVAWFILMYLAGEGYAVFGGSGPGGPARPLTANAFLLVLFSSAIGVAGTILLVKSLLRGRLRLPSVIALIACVLAPLAGIRFLFDSNFPGVAAPPRSRPSLPLPSASAVPPTKFLHQPYRSPSGLFEVTLDGWDVLSTSHEAPVTPRDPEQVTFRLGDGSTFNVWLSRMPLLRPLGPRDPDKALDRLAAITRTAPEGLEVRRVREGTGPGALHIWTRKEGANPQESVKCLFRWEAIFGTMLRLCYAVPARSIARSDHASMEEAMGRMRSRVRCSGLRNEMPGVAAPWLAIEPGRSIANERVDETYIYYVAGSLAPTEVLSAVQELRTTLSAGIQECVGRLDPTDDGVALRIYSDGLRVELMERDGILAQLGACLRSYVFPGRSVHVEVRHPTGSLLGQAEAPDFGASIRAGTTTVFFPVDDALLQDAARRIAEFLPASDWGKSRYFLRLGRSDKGLILSVAVVRGGQNDPVVVGDIRRLVGALTARALPSQPLEVRLTDGSFRTIATMATVDAPAVGAVGHERAGRPAPPASAP